ncbi:hypothetical protein ALC57_17290 [Trachymyrmex cornetzi]|uniref:Uncharacterized protein n=1 Tax=Trachymyrmex cornetzi TaxID=471704 RepID=A0A195DCS7_9HYME|nr:hypothetical protein ALC57_17290 [Trachymyrmex cornetzi]
MTLKKEARRSLKKSKSNHKATNYNDESASATQLGHPTKECKQAKPEPESFSIKRSSLKETSLKDAEDADNPSGKLERRSSFRRKFGALLKRSTELPAVINHSLQPIRRSMSFSKDLHRSHEPSRQPYRTSSVQWYNSLSTLSSLAEDEVDADCKRAGASEVFGSRVTQVTRTHSLMEKYPTTNLRRRVNTLSHPLATPYGRHSDYYHSNIDLSNPPCEASSLPALSRVAIDAYDNETKLSLERKKKKNVKHPLAFTRILVSRVFRRRDNKLQLKRRAERQKEVNKPLSVINHSMGQRAVAMDSKNENTKKS